MDKELAILENFFEDPVREYHIREIARRIKLNHMTARKYLNKLLKENLLKKRETKLYSAYSGNTTNKRFTNLKLFHNLEKIRESKLIEDLETAYDYPTVILFGSYSTATNTKNSDIDIFIITNIEKEFNTEKYEKITKRKISIHKVTEKEFQNMKIKNPELVNNICNGITLSGKLEVI
ncbi:nucleotidyltransferase domain-containing protein [Candidatus Woesearchaeota archaeon]|nr:nucleotidyltransferase domain-containing protein [Candidatus Woesearchaeota archaeon]